MSSSSGITKWSPNGTATTTELFRYPTATAVLLDYRMGQSEKPLATGVLVVNLIIQTVSPIIMVSCSINKFQWPLTEDTPIIRIGKHAFVFCIPGLLFGFQFTGVSEVKLIQGIIGVFMNYGHYKELGVEIGDEDPSLWSTEKTFVQPMAHDILLQFGHQPGRSRFSLVFHNKCETRATRLSATTKIVAKAITSGTLLPDHFFIKGGTNQPQNSFSASPSIEVFTCLMDALEISWLISYGLFPAIMHPKQPLQNTFPPIRRRLWKLNEMGLINFLKGLDSIAEHEVDEVVPPTSKGKGKGKGKGNTFVANKKPKSKRSKKSLIYGQF